MRFKNICKEAIETYGVYSQIAMFFEEASELQKELCKFLRGDKKVKNKIAEEIGDLEIILEQLKLMFDIEEKVEVVKEEKLKRLEINLLNYKKTEQGNEVRHIHCDASDCVNYFEDSCMKKWVKNKLLFIKECDKFEKGTNSEYDMGV